MLYTQSICVSKKPQNFLCISLNIFCVKTNVHFVSPSSLKRVKSELFQNYYFLFQSRKYSADGKAELAFKVFDKNHDGYITKGEMLKVSKNLTKEQVNLSPKHDSQAFLKKENEFLETFN